MEWKMSKLRETEIRALKKWAQILTDREFKDIEMFLSAIMPRNISWHSKVVSLSTCAQPSAKCYINAAPNQLGNEETNC
jgi:hypothetical protein